LYCLVLSCFVFLFYFCSSWYKYSIYIKNNHFNLFDVVFRVVELGVALWFPCVLWNCMR
jgi:hypothetical protein